MEKKLSVDIININIYNYNHLSSNIINSIVLKTIKIYNLSGDLIFEGSKYELIYFMKNLSLSHNYIFVHNLTNYQIFELLDEDWDIIFLENDSLQLITTNNID